MKKDIEKDYGCSLQRDDINTIIKKKPQWKIFLPRKKKNQKNVAKIREPFNCCT